MKRAFVVAGAVAVLLIAMSASAVTYIVPTDRDLVKRADGIVLATAIESHAQLNKFGGIVTVATFVVDEVIKGTVDSTPHLELVEAGGAVGDVWTVIPGSPRYVNGRKYLIFLRHDSLGNWATWGFGLGQFTFEGDTLTRGSASDTLLGVEEGDWSPHLERTRQSDRFLSFVHLVAMNPLVPANDDYYVAPASSANHAAPGPKIQPNARFRIAASGMTVPGLDAVAGLNAATANWTGVAGGNIHYSTGSLNFAATGGLAGLGSGHPDGHNAVMFNSPDVPPGAAAVGGISNSSGAGYACGAATCFPIVEVDVAVGTSFSGAIGQAVFNALVTHEVGHTLGLRHSDGTSNPLSPQNDGGCVINGTTCTHAAIMNSSVGASNSTMQTYDNNAAVGVYGGGTATTYLWSSNFRWTNPTATFDYCSLPFITTQPQASPASISSGNSSQLTVVVSGADPLTYQWYIGSVGNTSQPTGTNSSSISVSPTSTTSYWVRVSNGCGGSPVDSSAVTVTVTGACTAPGISAQPTAAPASINAGNSSTLSVTATGSATLSYQWYLVPVGNTSQPVGTNASSISVSPTVDTSYWVRVTNGCGSIDSNSVRVAVTAGCAPASIQQQPVATPSTISTGQSSQISVVGGGTGPLTYQWYVGTTGNTTTPVPGGTNAQVSVSPTSTTNYWVRITNSCGQADSNSATVTFSNGCAPPNVLAQPQDQTVTPGQVSLFVGYTGTTGNVNWYQGTAPDTSHFVGSGQNLQISVTQTTQFWAQITNNCGVANSRTATITVTQSCTSPGVTSINANPTTVAPSAASVLTVVATGTSLSYQWYRGNSGDTSNPISNATSASTTVNPATTTSYWVRISNSCGTLDSVKVTVTVSTQCTPPTITTQPLSTKILSGQKVTLSVIANGAPLTYQWYQGPVDNTDSPVGTNSSNIEVQPFVTTTFWVKVTNSCGDAKSNAAVITVSPAKHRAVAH